MKALRSKSTLLTCILLLLCITAWATFHVWTRHMATELGYTMSAQQAIKEQLLSENKALKLEISTLKNTKRLENIAKNELGLSVPGPDQVVYLWLDE